MAVRRMQLGLGGCDGWGRCGTLSDIEVESGWWRSKVEAGGELMSLAHVIALVIWGFFQAGAVTRDLGAGTAPYAVPVWPFPALG
jgi:hypothetical protein